MPPAARVMRLAAQILGGDAGAVTRARRHWPMAWPGCCARCRSTMAGTSFICRSICWRRWSLTPEEFFHLEKNDPRLAAAVRQAALQARAIIFWRRARRRAPGAALAAHPAGGAGAGLSAQAAAGRATCRSTGGRWRC